MYRLIRIIVAITIVIIIMLGFLLGAARKFASEKTIAFQAHSGADMDIYIHDYATDVTHNVTRVNDVEQTMRQLSSLNSIFPLVQLIHEGDDVSPVWSPNGQQIAFVSYPEGNANIYILDLNTSNIFQVTSDIGSELAPVWSPDGTKLAFEVIRNGYPSVTIIDLETGLIDDLAEYGFTSEAPSWSPDSTHIVFQAKQGHFWGIYIFDLISKESHRITHSARDEFNPVWRPHP